MVLPSLLAPLGVGLSLLFGLLLWGLWHRQRRAQQQVERTLQTVQTDLRALCNAAVTVGDRVKQLERHIGQLAREQKELGERQEQLGQSEPEEQSYAQAIKLAHKGAGVEELMDICGLSRGEAELVTMMHRLDQDA